MTPEKTTQPVGTAAENPTFSRYQIFVVAMLAFLQFTIILDFTIMSPLGAFIMPSLGISPQQFGAGVSAYAFSAGIASIISAGFADRFDRKRLLLFFYAGFILGTLLCALATSYHLLLAGRIVTGLFGGVIGAVVLAITTDLFPLRMRGRVMGFVQTAFAASQILGVPAGIYLSNLWDWHAAFFAIIVITVPAGLLVVLFLKPVTGHLAYQRDGNPFQHLLRTVTEPRYTLAFAVTTLLATGGFMLMPFGSAYTVNNIGIDVAHLPMIYLASGLCNFAIGPFVGKASDQFGKFRVYLIGTVVSIVMISIYTHLGRSSLPTVIVVNILLFVGIFSRMIPSQALISAIPDISQRGSFNAVSASIQQFSGGVGSMIAGAIIVLNSDGTLLHFDWLGYIVVATSLVSLTLMYFINRSVLTPAGAVGTSSAVAPGE